VKERSAARLDGRQDDVMRAEVALLHFERP
jgi:hypothetical protein